MTLSRPETAGSVSAPLVRLLATDRPKAPLLTDMFGNAPLRHLWASRAAPPHMLNIVS